MKSKSGGSIRSQDELSFPNTQVVDTVQFTLPKPPLQEIFLKEKYLQEGLSSHEIAALTFSSRSHVTRCLKRFEIPLSPITRRVNGSHVYGFKKHKGKSCQMKKEQEVIKLIKLHRSIGLSYQKIADKLNGLNIETKTAKGAWYPKVLRQIYLREVRT